MCSPWVTSAHAFRHLALAIVLVITITFAIADSGIGHFRISLNSHVTSSQPHIHTLKVGHQTPSPLSLRYHTNVAYPPASHGAPKPDHRTSAALPPLPHRPLRAHLFSQLNFFWLLVCCIMPWFMGMIAAYHQRRNSQNLVIHNAPLRDLSSAWVLAAARARKKTTPSKKDTSAIALLPAPSPLQSEMTNSFMRYAMSVVLGRTLPDVRDGLKPVHRRILYALHDMGLTSGARFKKSAAVVGDVLGKYHPHGDTAVYDALVRMAQDFIMSEMLVDGQGNFGSIDDDPPAAMRYTECRLQPFAGDALMSDLNASIVDFVGTYDGSRKEPLVLPARVPLLLVNGSSGIAVGMTTNIPPHNLGEVIDACLLVVNARVNAIKKRAGVDVKGKVIKVTDDMLQQVIPAPDFPTGGLIIGHAGASKIHRTGEGTIVMRAKMHVENVRIRGSKEEREAIIVTELPYMVVKGKLVEQLLKALDEGSLEGVQDVRDESDRDGLRVVITLKKGATATVVQNNLLRRTRLETTLSAKFLAIVHSVDSDDDPKGASKGNKGTASATAALADMPTRPRPERITLHGILDNWLDFRFRCVLRRAHFHLQKAEAEAHLKEGLVIALKRIDEVVDLIRKSRDTAEARAVLCRPRKEKDPRTGAMGYGLSQVQADAVLETQLSRLTGLQREKLEAQTQELAKEITRLRNIMSDDSLVYDEIRLELETLKKRYAKPRRTTIIEEEASVTEKELVANDPSIIVVTQKGTIKRVPLESLNLPSGKRRKISWKAIMGRRSTAAASQDDVSQLISCHNHDLILAITDTGTMYQTWAFKVPASGTGRGVPLKNVWRLPKGVKVTTVFTLSEEDAGITLEEMYDSEDGTSLELATDMDDEVKTEVEDASEEGVEEDVESAFETSEDVETFILLVTQQGRMKKLPVSELNLTRHRMQVIKLDAGDAVFRAHVCMAGDQALVVTQKGKAIRFSVDAVPRGSRNTKARTQLKIASGDDVADLTVANDSLGHDELVLVSSSGMAHRMDLDVINTQRPTTAARSVVKLSKDDLLVAGRACCSVDDVLFITTTGAVASQPCEDVPLQSEPTKGHAIPRTGAGADEPIATLAVLPKEMEP